MKLTEAKTILVTFLMQLGDLVLTTPFLTALRKAVPEAKIVYLIDEKWLDIVKCNPDIDEILTIDRKGKDRGFPALWTYSAQLKERNFDYVINLNPSERCTFLAAFSGAKYKTGATPALFKYFFDKRLTLDRGLHAADMYLDVLRQLDVKDLSNDGLKIVAEKSAVQEAQSFYEKNGVQSGDSLVGFNIGSASATKCWLPERFAQVADHVAEKGCKPVFFGSAGELKMVKQTLDKMQTNSYLVATGGLSVGGLVAALNRLDLLVTNDSGPMHVAISQKVPIVALYGPSKPDLYGPYKADKTFVVRAVPPCDGCEDRMKHVCPDMKCMKNISVRQVNDAVDKLFEGSR